MKVGSNKNPKGKLYAKFYNAMRTLKNNGLVTTSAAKTNRIEQRNDESRNGKTWMARDFSKSLFYIFIFRILIIVIFSIRNEYRSNIRYFET